MQVSKSVCVCTQPCDWECVCICNGFQRQNSDLCVVDRTGCKCRSFVFGVLRLALLNALNEFFS